METVSMSVLLSLLRLKSGYQDSETYLRFPADFETLLSESAESHNASFRLSADSSNVPYAERNCVVILGHIAICRIRATKFANQSDSSSGGSFQVDRSTPFTKNMKLIEALEQAYQKECAARGVASTSQPRVSSLIFTDPDTSQKNPLPVVSAPPAISLDSPVLTGAQAVLTFSFEKFADHNVTKVLYKTGADSILQPWNLSSKSGISGIHDDTEVFSIGSFLERSCRLDELTLGEITHRFVVCTQNISGLYTFSNEVTVVGAALPPPDPEYDP